MRPWAERQGQFAAALCGAQQPMPPGCVAPDGLPDEARFAVYRNNVAASLIECLQASYPAIERLLGEACFREAARQFVAETPPRSPVMLEYGAGFAEFLAQLEPLAALPYLADVARIERAWLEAYHAAEASALDPAALAAVPEHRAGDLCLTLHPSVRIVQSAFPALTIWRGNIAAAEPTPLDLQTVAQDSLVARPEAEVEVRALSPGGAMFLSALGAGETLTEAAALASAAAAEFNLTDHLTALLGSGLVIAVRLKRRRTRGH
ncbi:MAG: HvfC/BufC N-terminal domain-containing protein [Steroidobacteraceae bacterium]